MCNLKKFLAMALALVLVLSCAPVIPFTARAEAETPAPVAEPEFNDAASASDWVLACQGFKASDKATYEAAMEYLKTDTTTYADAYNRLTAALASLNAGADYYDDFQVFGRYVSDLDDKLTSTGEAGTLQPGEYFYASTNTTNYNYMFGGAYAQRLEASISGKISAGNLVNTFPTKADIEELFVPSFHFGRWDYEGAAAENQTFADPTEGITSNYSAANKPNSGLTVGMINRLVLNPTKTGAGCTGALESFSVQVDDGTGAAWVYFYHKDTKNWAALSFSKGNRTAWSLKYCVDGVITDKWNSDTWEVQNRAQTNKYNSNGNSWLIQGTQTANFTWNTQKQCYVLSVVHDKTGLEMYTKDLDASFVGTTPEKMSNLILSDTGGGNTSNNQYKSQAIGLKTVALQYAHGFTKQDVTTAEKKYEANCSNPAEYYTQCVDCGLSSKGYTNETFFDPSGTLGGCVYEDMYDAFVHWQGCPGCGRIDPQNPKEPHDATCGHEVTAESTALSALQLQGFYGNALAGYQAGLALLEDKKADETAIKEGVAGTWKEAYDRLANAIEKLDGGMTYYDDFMVFGSYISNMDDTGLVAGDKFVASTNTTNYDYIFGGAYAQKLTASISGYLGTNDLKGTFPLGVSATMPFFPSFHFQRWDHAGATAANQTFTDTTDHRVGNYTPVDDAGSGLTSAMINRMVLNTGKIGVAGINVLEQFTIITDNGSKPTQIFFDYTDANNWSALEIGKNSNRTSFVIYVCVNGTITRKWDTDVWQIQGKPANNSAYNSSNPNSWLVSGNVIHNFVWDYTNNCYVYTAIHQDTGKTIVTKNLDETLLGYAPKKMGTLMMMGVQHYNGTLAQQQAAFAVKGISVKFVDASAEPHVCTPTGNWISDNNGNHYKNCSCGRKVESSVMSCNIPDEFTTVDGVHTKACADCGYVAERGNCTDHQSDLLHDGVNHWKECTVCGTEITGTKEACATTGGYQWENDQHWATYACGAELPKENCEGTEYVTADGQHQLKCATCDHVYGEKKQCSGTELVNDGANGHYTKCATCGVKIDSTVEDHNKDVPATYEANAFCSCGYEHEGTMLEKIAPEILGSKILKAGAAVDQKLRIDIDFTKVLTSLQGSTETIVCGAIVHPLNSDIMKDGELDVELLKGFKGNTKYDVKSRLTGHAEDMIMRLTIGMDAADFGKRVAVIAYIQVGDTIIYSSDSNQNTKDNAAVGLENGVIQTGVMRVMKSILKDTTDNGYNGYIADAAEDYVLSGNAPTGVNQETVIAMVNDYLAGDIKPGHANYATARTYAMNVFFYCSIIADSKS